MPISALASQNLDLKRLLGLAAVNTAERDVADKIQGVLTEELHHRMKNMMTMVTAIVRQSLKTAQSLPEAAVAIETRLMAMARAHDLLLKADLKTAGLKSVVLGAIEQHNSALGRIVVRGDDFEIVSGAIVPVTLMLNELCTNAVKYGALSEEQGKVLLSWKREGDAIAFRWTETGRSRGCRTRPQKPGIEADPGCVAAATGRPGKTVVSRDRRRIRVCGPGERLRGAAGAIAMEPTSWLRVNTAVGIKISPRIQLQSAAPALFGPPAQASTNQGGVSREHRGGIAPPWPLRKQRNCDENSSQVSLRGCRSSRLDRDDRTAGQCRRDGRHLRCRESTFPRTARATSPMTTTTITTPSISAAPGITGRIAGRCATASACSM